MIMLMVGDAGMARDDNAVQAYQGGMNDRNREAGSSRWNNGLSSTKLMLAGLLRKFTIKLKGYR